MTPGSGSLGSGTLGSGTLGRQREIAMDASAGNRITPFGPIAAARAAG